MIRNLWTYRVRVIQESTPGRYPCETNIREAATDVYTRVGIPNVSFGIKRTIVIKFERLLAFLKLSDTEFASLHIWVSAASGVIYKFMSVIHTYSRCDKDYDHLHFSYSLLIRWDVWYPFAADSFSANIVNWTTRSILVISSSVWHPHNTVIFIVNEHTLWSLTRLNMWLP